MLRSLGISDAGSRGSVRFGLGRFNTEADVDFGWGGGPNYYFQDSEHVAHRSEGLLFGTMEVGLFDGRFRNRLVASRFRNGLERKPNWDTDDVVGTATGFDYLGALRLPLGHPALPELTTIGDLPAGRAIDHLEEDPARVPV